MLPLPDRIRVMAAPLTRRGRVPGLRTAKTVLAAVLAYGVASLATGNPRPVLAPLTALLVVQLTLYETLTSGLRRVVSVVAGVLLAVGFSLLVGFDWWSLGILIAVALVLGKLLRVGEQLMEVPISAMLVLAVSHAGVAAQSRVYETLLGAAVGVTVNTVIAPPLYLQPAGDALIELSERMRAVLRATADDLRASWSADAARGWLEMARSLGRDLARAERAFERAERSMRLNPRGRRMQPAPGSLRAALNALEHAAVAMRGAIRSLADLTELTPHASPYDEEVRRLLVGALEGAGEAIVAFAGLAATDVREATGEDAQLRAALALAHQERAAVLTRHVVDVHSESSAWELHGALLADLGRILREIDPDEGPDAQAVPRPGRLPRRSPEAALRDAVVSTRGAARRLRPR